MFLLQRTIGQTIIHDFCPEINDLTKAELIGALFQFMMSAMSRTTDFQDRYETVKVPERKIVT